MLSGTALMGTGIAMSISTGLGADPLAWLWEGLTGIFPITLLQANLILAALMLIPPLIFDKTHIGISTLIQPVITGLSTSFVLDIIGSHYHNCFLLISGLIIMAVGIGIYNSVELGRGSYDCLIFLISGSFSVPIGKIRMAGDLSLCIIAFLLCGHLTPGPIIAMFCVGPILNVTLNFMKNHILCFGDY